MTAAPKQDNDRKFIQARLENRSGFGWVNLLGLVEIPTKPGLPDVVIWKGRTFQFNAWPRLGDAPSYLECSNYYAPIEIKAYGG